MIFLLRLILDEKVRKWELYWVYFNINVRMCKVKKECFKQLLVKSVKWSRKIKEKDN